MRRIKRTKITVIRTETVFLKIPGGGAAEYASELLKLQTAGFAENKTDSVLEIEAIKQDTESEGEVK